MSIDSIFRKGRSTSGAAFLISLLAAFYALNAGNQPMLDFAIKMLWVTGVPMGFFVGMTIYRNLKSR